jgi:hypothetical protein
MMSHVFGQQLKKSGYEGREGLGAVAVGTCYRGSLAEWVRREVSRYGGRGGRGKVIDLWLRGVGTIAVMKVPVDASGVVE